MRRALGRARIEACFTWLFESLWRSTCPAAAASAAAELFAAADAEIGYSSRLESRPRPRFSWKETGFECWQPRTAAIVQHHQYGQSEQRHRHLRSGRGSIYLFEGALDAQRRRQHEQVLGAMKSAQPSLSSKEPKVVFCTKSRFFVQLGARIAFMRFQGWVPTR